MLNSDSPNSIYKVRIILWQIFSITFHYNILVLSQLHWDCLMLVEKYVSYISMYEPSWQTATGELAGGFDEDTITLAIAAARPIVVAGGKISSVFLISSNPIYLDGSSSASVLTALGLLDCPIYELLGGADTVLTVVATASEGALIIAVENETSAFSGAVLIGAGGGLLVKLLGTMTGSLPVVSRRSGQTVSKDYGDARLQREIGTVPLVKSLKHFAEQDGETLTLLAGLNQTYAKKLGISRELVNSKCAVGVASSIQALFDCCSLSSLCFVGAIAKSNGAVVSVRPTSRVLNFTTSSKFKAPVLKDRDESKSLPISLAAYSRSFNSKVGHLAKKCLCGAVSFPPKYLCSNCGGLDQSSFYKLGFSAKIHTLTKIFVDVPGKITPYVIAVVELNDDVRALVGVTDYFGQDVKIGMKGELVLRVIAEREGIPDYGYSLKLEEDQ